MFIEGRGDEKKNKKTTGSKGDESAASLAFYAATSVSEFEVRQQLALLEIAVVIT